MSDDDERSTILLVDPSSNASETAAYLEEQGALNVLVEGDVGSGMAVLGDADFDCVVARRRIDGTTGLDLLERLNRRGTYASVPFILFARDGGEPLVDRAFEAGVTDYVIDTEETESLALLAKRVTNAVASDREVTARSEAIDARFLELAESLTVGVLSIDEDSRIQYVNPAMAEIVGYDPAELTGDSLATLIPDRLQDQHFEGLNEYLSTGEKNISWDGVELPAQHRSGEEIPVRVAFSEFEHGTDHYFTGTLTDLREQEARERELRRQNERLEQFASVVSHDLRNPLSVAKGNLDLAREQGEYDRLDTVADAHDRMEAIIDDLLTLAREGRDVEDPEPVDLLPVAEDAWDTVVTDGASLSVVGDATFLGDRSRVRTLLENLFRNSVDHGPEQGVSVEVGSLSDGFYVADDGPGIPEADRDQVFESGYTTADSGTGFGLTIVAEVATAHGWDVEITESEMGGARIEIWDVEFA